jgi:LCP family protein required for cell wall assembly
MFSLSRFPRSRFSPLAPRRPRPSRAALAAGVVCAVLTAGAVMETHSAARQDGRPPSHAPGPGYPQGGSAGPGGPARGALTGLPEAARPPRGPGVNILLFGLDRRAGLSRQTKDRLRVGGQQCDCTDVMMLVHIAADRRRVSVVSVPRDSYVPFAPHRDKQRPPSRSRDGKETNAIERADKETSGGEGPEKETSGSEGSDKETSGSEGSDKGLGRVAGRVTRHFGKINSAYAHGGPALTVRTVEQATGVRLDHYAESDFTGFVRTVDRLGGATVCTGKPMRDRNSGLDLPVGTHDLDGVGALRYARARHVDPPGDLGRMRRQQRMFEAMLTALTGERTGGDPARLSRAARVLHTWVRTDAGLTPSRLADLGAQLRGLRPARTEFATVPLSDFDHRVPVWGSTLVWDKPRARALFADLRADRPLTGNPRTQPAPGRRPVALAPGLVTVRVEGERKAAVRVERALRAEGFRVLRGRQAAAPGRTPKRTRIRYDSFLSREAPTLATALPGARLEPVKVAGRRHSQVFTVRLGASGTEVAKVVLDRSSVEGAPVTGDTLDCSGPASSPGR